MISKKMKEPKGVTLVALTITVTIILILTSAIIYNVRKNISIYKLEALQNDIMNLRDKVSSYYAQYGALPIVNGVEYTNISKIMETGVISDAVDTGNFYVIKLSSLDNLTLTYGEDFEKISKNEVTTAEQINGLEDLYIINEDSHNIFYARGVTVDNERFHTDYTQDTIDTVPVSLVEIPELKVGDYVNYTPSSVVDTQVAELNAEINAYSGYSTEQTVSQEDLKWRVLEIDNEGNPTKLISASPTSTLYLSGANGYNNAVYLLNKACSTLYSGEYGDAQSITIEDFEKHYSNAGKDARDGYTGAVQYGKLKRYTGSYANYPKLATQENKMGIDTETYTDDEGNTFNTIKTDGINLSDKQTEPYNEGSARASTNGITITQTYYNLDSVYGGLANAYVKDDGRNVYYELFHIGMNNYWLASRCVLTDSNSSNCNFDVRCAYSGSVYAGYLFYSGGGTGNGHCGLRPVVSLKSGVKANYAGAYKEDETYATWDLYM